MVEKLKLEWSPEQISGWLKIEFPDDQEMRVSHETIYLSLFVQARGVLKRELMKHLRTKRTLRYPKAAGPTGAGKIVGAISIRERPPEVEDRAVPGHWEGDLLVGSNGSQVATLVERHARYVKLVKIDDRTTATLVPALAREVKTLPAELRRSLTWDRGHEMAAHKKFTVATDVKVYFADPHSPWQRGTNENTNGLLRQYLAKGEDISSYTQQQLNAIARRLNGRPRKTLGFRTPAEVFNQLVA